VAARVAGVVAPLFYPEVKVVQVQVVHQVLHIFLQVQVRLAKGIPLVQV
jgi:hypothetical protein